MISKVLLLITALGLLFSCDYAKPTDVEAVGDRVTQLDAEVSALRDSVETLQNAVGDRVTQLDAEVSALRDSVETLQNVVQEIEALEDRIDSVADYTTRVNVVYGDGSLVSKGLLEIGAEITGTLSDNFEEAHIYFFRTSSAQTVRLTLDSSDDVSLNLMRLIATGWVPVVRQHGDLGSPLADYNQREEIVQVIDPGDYAVVIERFFEEGDPPVIYRLVVNF